MASELLSLIWEIIFWPRPDWRRRIVRPKGQIWPIPAALGFAIPPGPPSILFALRWSQMARRQPRRLGRFLPGFFVRRGIAHNCADGPGDRFEVAIHGIVIGCALASGGTLFQVIPVAIHLIDQLA